ncbi:hypothetical protein H4Q26_016397 [Puccinia striiformis f. sp. tritici PST-130]|nr:hypothetical protein H4Q26_016397 [Puccinia striiformis f. sp. tritici PST-130]
MKIIHSYIKGIAHSLRSARLLPNQNAHDVLPHSNANGLSSLTGFRRSSLQLKLVALIIRIQNHFDKQQTMRPKFGSSVPSYGKGKGGNIQKWAALAEENRQVQRDIDSLVQWFDLSESGVLRNRIEMITQHIDGTLLHPIKILKRKNLAYPQALEDTIPIIEFSQQFAFIEKATAIPDTLRKFILDIEYDDHPSTLENSEPGQSLIDEFVEISQILTDSCDVLLQSDPSQSDHHLALIQDYRIWHDRWFAELVSSVEKFYSTYKGLFPEAFRSPPASPS